MNPRNWLILVLVSIAALLIYSRLWTKAPFSITDTPTYLELLPDLSHFHLTKLYGRTPGLPLYMMLVGTGRAYFYVTLLIDLISVCAMAAFLFRLKVRTGFVWAFVVIALLPPYVQNVGYLASEALTASFLVFGFVCLSMFLIDRLWLYGALASLWFAGAALIRPTNAITPFVLAFMMLVWGGRRLIRAAILLVSLTALALGTWIGYNGAKFHFFGITYMTGYYMSNGTPELYPLIDNPIAREELLKARNSMYAVGMSPNDAIYLAKVPLERRLGLDDVSLSRFLVKMNMKLIEHHPQAYLEDVARASFTYWFPYSTKALGSLPAGPLLSDGIQDFVATAFWLSLVVFFGLWVGLKILNKETPRLEPKLFSYTLALAIIFQTQMVSCTTVGGTVPRYRSVTDPLMIFATVLVADWAYTTWHASRQPGTSVSLPARS